MRRFNQLILLTLIFICVVAITNFQQTYVLQKTVIDLSADVNILQNKIDYMLTQSLKISRNNNANQETVKIRGLIIKEAIPQEIAAGEYWYWLYFDEPYLLRENTTSLPQYLQKIQVFPPWDNNDIDIENYLNTSVEVYGSVTWGYAESTVIRIITLTKL